MYKHNNSAIGQAVTVSHCKDLQPTAALLLLFLCRHFGGGGGDDVLMSIVAEKKSSHERNNVTCIKWMATSHYCAVQVPEVVRMCLERMANCPLKDK